MSRFPGSAAADGAGPGQADLQTATNWGKRARPTVPAAAAGGLGETPGKRSQTGKQKCLCKEKGGSELSFPLSQRERLDPRPAHSPGQVPGAGDFLLEEEDNQRKNSLCGTLSAEPFPGMVKGLSRPAVPSYPTTLPMC